MDYGGLQFASFTWSLGWNARSSNQLADQLAKKFHRYGITFVADRCDFGLFLLDFLNMLVSDRLLLPFGVSALSINSCLFIKKRKEKKLAPN